MKKLSLLLLWLAIFSSGVCAQANVENLDRTLNDLQKKSNFPGFAAAIIDESGAVYAKGFGFADLEKKNVYTAQTVQPIGSVSKTFIGVALMKAVELNLFSLETDINDVLPFRVYNPNFPKSEIKIRHLATHTSGIVDREEVYTKTYLKTAKPNVALGAFLKDYFDPKGKYYSRKNFDNQKAGAAFNYTNIGAALAAYLIETKSGMAFDDFTAKYVFTPLEMKQASWLFDQTKTMDYATLYDKKVKPLPAYSSITYPDGSLRTSVEDLGKYLSEIIRGFDGKGKILSKESFQTLLGKQFAAENLPLKTNSKEPNQGIFFVHRRNGEIGHTGSDFGVSAFVFFNPETKIGRIFVTNIDVSESEKLAAQFAEIWKVLEQNEAQFIKRK